MKNREDRKNKFNTDDHRYLVKLTFSQMITDICVNLCKVSVLIFGMIFFFPAVSLANPDMVSNKSSIIWQAEVGGDHTFTDGLADGVALDPEDKTIVYANLPGLFEIENAIDTDGRIQTITANWESTGEVRLEVSADNGANYTQVVNGLPLREGFMQGDKLKWRAYLLEDSELKRVKISYTDSYGVVGDFGNPDLSGFKYRKSLYINGAEGNLYNYQIEIKIAEGAQGNQDTKSPADVYCEGKIENDFKDVRFTAGDGLTSLSYYLEEITGNKPARIATYLVKVPQLPSDGMALYLYYGNQAAGDLSSAAGVFDLYDDFTDKELNTKIWEASIYEDGSYTLADSKIKIDAAKLISKTFQLKDGIIEFRGRSTAGNELRTIIKSAKGPGSEDQSQVAYSSNYQGAQHCVAVGEIVEANDSKAIAKDTYYNFRVIVDGGNITFQRYPDNSFDESKKEATVTYGVSEGAIEKGFIGMMTGGLGKGDRVAEYDWIRARKLSRPDVALDLAKTGIEEETNLANFQNTTVAANGDIVLVEGASEGIYISNITKIEFNARIMKPVWTENLRGTRDEGRGTTVISLDISANNAVTYKQNCKNDTFYYASKKDFAEGNNLQYRLKLLTTGDWRLTANPGIQEVSLDYRPGSILLTSPSKGTVWAKGTNKKIAWTALDYEPTYEMKLEYSLDGGSTYNTIAERTANSGSHLWTVPDELANKSRIRISDANDTSIKNEVDFRIGAADREHFEKIEAKEEEKITPPEEGTEAKPEESANTQETVKEESGYEFLVRAIDAGDGVSKKGDCITFKPAGWEWSETEKAFYAIIRINDIAYQKAQELCSSKDVTIKAEKDETEIDYSPKKYKFDLDKFSPDLKKKWLDKEAVAEVVDTQEVEVIK